MNIALTGIPARMKSLPHRDISNCDCHRSLMPEPMDASLLLTKSMEDHLDYDNRKCIYSYEDKYTFARILTSDSLIFDSHFESANLQSAYRVYPSPASRIAIYDLYMHYDVPILNRANTQWYYFSVSNMKAGQEVTFILKNFEKSSSLYSDGMRPLVYSVKGEQGWTRGGFNISYTLNKKLEYLGPDKTIGKQFFSLSFNYIFEYSQDTCYFAFCHPYTYTDLQLYLNRIESHLEKKNHVMHHQHHHSTQRNVPMRRSMLEKIQLQRQEDPHLTMKKQSIYRKTILCKTNAGNNCYLITITEPASSLKSLNKRTGVVVTARVHPGETNSSLLMEGFIDFLTGDNLEARQLRKCYIFKIIPMLNPDGVINGNNRTSLAGVDLNRHWGNPDKILHPTVYYTKELIKKMKLVRPVSVVLDLHGHSHKEGVFFYGCIPDKKLLKVTALPETPRYASSTIETNQYTTLSPSDSILCDSFIGDYGNYGYNNGYNNGNSNNPFKDSIEEAIDISARISTPITTSSIKITRRASTNSYNDRVRVTVPNTGEGYSPLKESELWFTGYGAIRDKPDQQGVQRSQLTNDAGRPASIGNNVPIVSKTKEPIIRRTTVSTGTSLGVNHSNGLALSTGLPKTTQSIPNDGKKGDVDAYFPIQEKGNNNRFRVTPLDLLKATHQVSTPAQINTPKHVATARGLGSLSVNPSPSQSKRSSTNSEVSSDKNSTASHSGPSQNTSVAIAMPSNTLNRVDGQKANKKSNELTIKTEQQQDPISNPLIGTANSAAIIPTARDVVNWKIKYFPRIVSSISDSINLNGCSNIMLKNKASTMRIVMFAELGIDFSYTIEASIGGCKGFHFGTNDLKNIGESIGIGLLELYPCCNSNPRPLVLSSIGTPKSKDLEPSKDSFGTNTKGKSVNVKVSKSPVQQHRDGVNGINSNIRNNPSIDKIFNLKELESLRAEIISWRPYFNPNDSGYGASIMSSVGLREMIVHEEKATVANPVDDDNSDASSAEDASERNGKRKKDVGAPLVKLGVQDAKNVDLMNGKSDSNTANATSDKAQDDRTGPGRVTNGFIAGKKPQNLMLRSLANAYEETRKTGKNDQNRINKPLNTEVEHLNTGGIHGDTSFSRHIIANRSHVASTRHAKAKEDAFLMISTKYKLDQRAGEVGGEERQFQSDQNEDIADSKSLSSQSRGMRRSSMVSDKKSIRPKSAVSTTSRTPKDRFLKHTTIQQNTSKAYDDDRGRRPSGELGPQMVKEPTSSQMRRGSRAAHSNEGILNEADSTANVDGHLNYDMGNTDSVLSVVSDLGKYGAGLQNELIAKYLKVVEESHPIEEMTHRPIESHQGIPDDGNDDTDEYLSSKLTPSANYYRPVQMVTITQNPTNSQQSIADKRTSQRRLSGYTAFTNGGTDVTMSSVNDKEEIVLEIRPSLSRGLSYRTISTTSFSSELSYSQRSQPTEYKIQGIVREKSFQTTLKPYQDSHPNANKENTTTTVSKLSPIKSTQTFLMNPFSRDVPKGTTVRPKSATLSRRNQSTSSSSSSLQHRFHLDKREEVSRVPGSEEKFDLGNELVINPLRPMKNEGSKLAGKSPKNSAPDTARAGHASSKKPEYSLASPHVPVSTTNTKSPSGPTISKEQTKEPQIRPKSSKKTMTETSKNTENHSNPNRQNKMRPLSAGVTRAHKSAGISDRRLVR